MMNNYRFTLQRGSSFKKITCPNCGQRKCFTKYIDTEGSFVFPDNVGMCDHVNRCGYHYSPKAYFTDHPMGKEQLMEHDRDTHPVLPVATQCPPPPSFIDHQIMMKSLCAYDRNPLFTFLSRVMGKAAAEQLFLRYNVGTANAWGGSTVYWQVDAEGHIRTGKVMLYDPATGHRVKEPVAKVGWAHSLMKLESFNLRQCLFGEHLVRTRPLDKIMIVESEKTALIAAYFVPQYLWLATGGLYNLRPSEALRNRDVLLLPDLQAEERWREKLPALAAVCRTVAISDLLRNIATEEQRQAGLDIADFLLMEDTAEMVLARMVDANPCIQKLIDEYQLEIVGFHKDEETNDCLQS